MNSKEMLLRKIQAIHIMAVDLQLFLDTHPDNTHALADYKSVTKEYQSLKREYEQCYGPLANFAYMTTFDAKSWNNDLWPWERH